MSVDLEERIRQTLRDWAAEITDGADDGITDGTVGGGTRRVPLLLVTGGDRAPADAPMQVPATVRPAVHASDDDESRDRTPGPGAPAGLARASTTPSTRAATGWFRAWAAAGAAAVLLVAVVGFRAGAFGRPGTDTAVVPVGTGARFGDAGPAAPGSARGPRAVATMLPAGYRPVLRVENPSGVGPAESVQRFRLGTGSITLVIAPISGGPDGEPATTGDPSGEDDRARPSATLGWHRASGTRFEAVVVGAAHLAAVVEGLGDADAIAALGGLVPRSADLVDGFDPPAGAELMGEQLWPRGATKPSFTTVYYAAEGATDPSIAVSATEPTGSTDLDLVVAEGGSGRAEVAGAERVTANIDDVRAVAWLDGAGRLVTVRARGVSDGDMAAIVASVRLADDATWQALGAEISAAVAAMPDPTSIELPGLVLGYRGAPRPDDVVQGEWQPAGVCIVDGAGAQACGPFLEARGGLFGPRFTSPAGWAELTTWTIESGRYTTTVATDQGWWVLGGNETAARVTVTALVGGEPLATEVPTFSAPFGDLGVAYAARLPDDASAAIVSGTYERADDVPGTTLPHVEWQFEVRRPEG